MRTANILSLLMAALLIWAMPSSLLAQERDTGGPPAVRGRILDDQGQALPYAAAAIYTRTDTSLIKGTAADSEGRFLIRVPKGDYWLKLSFLSYSDRWIDVAGHSRAETDLGDITMSMDMETLDEVEVYAEREAVEFKLDKRVFNIQKDITNRGRNAADILDNIPSVAVDVEGNVSLRGSQAVRILIDGKPSGLLGISSSDALRQLQGDIIESIEVITNPSSKYEAEGEVGIINIILKKERKNGVNGSIDMNVGMPDAHGAALNLNFRRKDVNLFTSAGIRYQRRPGFGTIYQEFLLPDTTYSFNNRRDHDRGGLGGNVRFGTEFFFNPKNTLTISTLVSRSEGDNTLDMTYEDFDEDGVQTEFSLREEEEAETKEVLEFEAVYLKTFDSEDHKLNVSARKLQSIDLEDATIQQDFQSDADALLLQRSTNKENEDNLILQADYELPLSEDAKFEAGTRIGLRTIVNDFQVEEFGEDWTDVPGFVNELTYDEDIYAAYATYSNEQGRWGYQMGLRTEYTDIRTELAATDEENPRDYLNLFPTLFLSYDYSELNAIQLSYSRRINRPRFWALVPFYGFGDPRNFYAGNPDLNPEFIHSVELNRLTRSEQGSIVIGVYGRYKEGVIQRIINVTDNGTFTFPVNLGTGTYLGAEFSGSQRLKEWWRVNGSINVFREAVEGSSNGRDYSYETAALQSRLNSRWTIKKDYELQASLTYRSPQQIAQGRSLSITSMDLGLSTEVLNDKGTLTLSVRDVFNSRIRRRIIDEADYYSENEFQWRARVVQLSFNYRINQKKPRGRRSGGGFDGGGEM